MRLISNPQMIFLEPWRAVCFFGWLAVGRRRRQRRNFYVFFIGGRRERHKVFFLRRDLFWRSTPQKSKIDTPTIAMLFSGPVAFSKAHHFGCPAGSFRAPRAHPRQSPFRILSPIMKGIPAYSLLVKVFSGCVPVRCVETTLEFCLLSLQIETCKLRYVCRCLPCAPRKAYLLTLR